MRKQNVIRFGSNDFKALKEHLHASGDNESFAYALCSKAQGTECDIYICNRLIAPDADDLRNQSSASIEPTQECQAIAYGLAYELGLFVVDIHTHPFSKNAHFSSIDDHHGAQNAKYITENFPDGSTMGMLVLGKGFDNFEARIWNSENNCFDPVNRLEVLGAATDILTNQDRTIVQADDPYARHLLIPGWKQGLLENLKVSLGGVGGNGALIFESLLALGVGKYGWVMACDPDEVEASNLPRIPYAFPKDVGKFKSEVAQDYANRKAPDLNVYCYPEGIESSEMQEKIKESNVIIGAVDNDGARKFLNSLAARYMIPYIDLGTEIIPDASGYEAVGQVHIFVPGKTGCLICSGAIDPSEAALDTMSDEDKAQYESVGYIRGTAETPTPSVLHLNGVVSHLAISQLLRLVFNENFNGKEYLHYDRQNCSLLVASAVRDDNCPVCGKDGYLGAGDENTICSPESSYEENLPTFSINSKQENEDKPNRKKKEAVQDAQ